MDVFLRTTFMNTSIFNQDGQAAGQTPANGNAAAQSANNAALAAELRERAAQLVSAESKHMSDDERNSFQASCKQLREEAAKLFPAQDDTAAAATLDALKGALPLGMTALANAMQEEIDKIDNTKPADAAPVDEVPEDVAELQNAINDTVTAQVAGDLDTLAATKQGDGETEAEWSDDVADPFRNENAAVSDEEAAKFFADLRDSLDDGYEAGAENNSDDFTYNPPEPLEWSDALKESIYGDGQGETTLADLIPGLDQTEGTVCTMKGEGVSLTLVYNERGKDPTDFVKDLAKCLTTVTRSLTDSHDDMINALIDLMIESTGAIDPNAQVAKIHGEAQAALSEDNTWNGKCEYIMGQCWEYANYSTDEAIDLCDALAMKDEKRIEEHLVKWVSQTVANFDPFGGEHETTDIFLTMLASVGCSKMHLQSEVAAVVEKHWPDKVKQTAKELLERKRAQLLKQVGRDESAPGPLRYIESQAKRTKYGKSSIYKAIRSKTIPKKYVVERTKHCSKIRLRDGFERYMEAAGIKPRNRTCWKKKK